MRSSRAARITSAVVIITLSALGCAAKQDYEIVPRSRREELLRDRAVVMSGRVEHVTNYMGHLAGRPPKKHDLVIAVDRVEKGRYDAPVLELRGLRPLTSAEEALLPEPHVATFPNAKFLIGYDRRRNDSFTRLQLAPLE